MCVFGEPPLPPSILQTRVDGVYAIGDVASFPLLVAGGAPVRQEHVTHARSSAAQAAKAILGEWRWCRMCAAAVGLLGMCGVFSWLVCHSTTASRSRTQCVTE